MLDHVESSRINLIHSSTCIDTCNFMQICTFAAKPECLSFIQMTTHGNWRQITVLFSLCLANVGMLSTATRDQGLGSKLDFSSTSLSIHHDTSRGQKGFQAFSKNDKVFKVFSSFDHFCRSRLTTCGTQTNHKCKVTWTTLQETRKILWRYPILLAAAYKQRS